MAFITYANLKRIVRSIDPKEVESAGSVYVRPIYCFNWYEKQQLLLFKRLLSEPDLLIEEVFTSFKKKDKMELISEDTPPAYHLGWDCTNLHSDYEDYKIPKEIKNKGKDAIKEFRQWFKANEDLLEDPAAFSMRMYHKWRIRNTLEKVVYENSGSVEVHNLSLKEITDTIDDLLKLSAKMYHSSDDCRIVISKMSRYAYLGLSNEPLERNDTSIPNATVKEILKEYELQIKQPLKNLLRQYYMMFLNDQLDFDVKLLDRVGFKPCSNCCNQVSDVELLSA
jgi:hypothetical protein